MKFRAKIVDIGCIHQFTKILSGLSKITKTSIVRLSETNIVFTQTERVIGGGTSMWCELNQGDFFDEYRIEGKDESNQIYFEVINENLIRAMKSAQNAQSVKIRLTKKQTPCLTFEVILPSLTAHTRSVVHDVPVKIIPQRYWNEIQKPVLPNYDIKVVLPPLKTIKNIVERMKNLSGFMVVSASSDGNLQFQVKTDDVTVATHFKNISLETSRSTNSTSNVSENEENFEAKVDINKLVTFLNVQHFCVGNITCGIISNQAVHLFIHSNDVIFFYFIPAMSVTLA